MESTLAIPTRPIRKFVPEDLVINSWDKIKSLFDNLVDRKISTVLELEQWMLDQSELSAVLEEDMAWRYIKMNIDTTNKKLGERFSFWIKEISPNTAPYSHKLNLKLVKADIVSGYNIAKGKHVEIHIYKNQMFDQTN